MTARGAAPDGAAGDAPPPAAPTRPYVLPEGRIAVPADWQDQTIHIFAAGGGGGAMPEFSVVVHRDALLPGEDLDAYATRQDAGLRGTLPEFRLLREGALTLGGVPAREAEFRWTGEPGLMHQRQVSVLRQGRVMTVTGTAPERLWAKHAPAFAAVLASWRFPVLLDVPGAELGR